MQTVIMGDEAIRTGNADVIVAGGMESMTNAPYLLKKHRSGARIGHDTAYDHMFLDGLEDAYEEGRAMGSFAQCTADEYQLTREQMDDYAIESLRRAKDAIDNGGFKDEIVPVTIKSRAGETVVDTDEAPGRGRPDKIPQLKPAFAKEGTITAATSSSISDGAAAVVLTQRVECARQGPCSRSRASSPPPRTRRSRRSSPSPRSARSRRCCNKAGWKAADVDLWEVNEAFACVAMFAMKDLGIPPRQDQRPRRRDRARPPDRRQRHAHPRHADQRAEAEGRQARRREPVHRRRRSDRGRGGACLRFNSRPGCSGGMGTPLEKGRKPMRFTICLTAALAFCAASTPVAAKPAHFQLMSTSWSYVDHGTKVRQSVDAKGNYIENAVSGKHIDHGTAVMKDNKACFTSAMTKRRRDVLDDKAGRRSATRCTRSATRARSSPSPASLTSL